MRAAMEAHQYLASGDGHVGGSVDEIAEDVPGLSCAALGTSLGLHGHLQVVATDFNFGLDRGLRHHASLTNYTFHRLKGTP